MASSAPPTIVEKVANITSTGEHPALDSDEDSDEDSEEEAELAEEATSGRCSPMRQTGELLKKTKVVLTAWHIRKRNEPRLRHSSMTAATVLPDSNLKSIASQRRVIKTVENLCKILKPLWCHLDAWGEKVLDIVHTVDREDADAQCALNEAHKATRKRELEDH